MHGSQSYDGSAWTVNGVGADIGGSSDDFYFVRQSLNGDGAIIARLTALAPQGSLNSGAKAGVMVRAGNGAQDAFYYAYVTPDGSVDVLYRPSAGATAIQQVLGSAGGLPIYLQITRAGNVFSASASSDGVTWTPLAGSAVALGAMSDPALVGMAVTSHDTAQIATATFDHVSIVTPTPVPTDTVTPSPTVTATPTPTPPPPIIQ